MQCSLYLLVRRGPSAHDPRPLERPAFGVFKIVPVKPGALPQAPAEGELEQEQSGVEQGKPEQSFSPHAKAASLLPNFPGERDGNPDQ